MTCGCGTELKPDETYQVEKQIQCKECMEDAINCRVPVLVRKIDRLEAIQNEHRTAS
jgi:hypothetical protein